MTQRETAPGAEDKKVLDLLRNLDRRITRLERYLALPPLEDSSLSAGSELERGHDFGERAEESGRGTRLEQRIGEFALAWVGSFIFLLGIVFLMVYTISLGYDPLAGALGYVATIGFYLLSRIWSRTLPHISRVLLSSSAVLLYFTTLRLHYFSARPLIESSTIALLLLLLAVGLQLGYALRTGSQWLAGLALLFGFISALLSDTTHVCLPLIAGFSAVAVYLARRRHWWSALNASILLAYGSHLIWLINNPIMGHPVKAVAEHQYNLAYLFLYPIIFSLPALFLNRETTYEPASITMVALNCLGFSMMVTMVVFALFQQEFAEVYLGTAGLFLLASVAQWIWTHQSFSPSVYACFGFMALSIALYGYAGIPQAHFWLAWQSLLVVSMALWFRSRLLVVVNFMIFLGIMLVYLTTSPSLDLANFSFAIVAHASARIMNWQKDRLTLRTKILRNLYLITAFVFVLYAVYHAVPQRYVTLSWTSVAAGYFLLSLLLGNIKYRWMGMAATFLTVFYLFFVDLARLDPRFRVAAFLFLGIIALAISLFYSKFRRFLAGGPRE